MPLPVATVRQRVGVSGNRDAVRGDVWAGSVQLLCTEAALSADRRLCDLAGSEARGSLESSSTFAGVSTARFTQLT